MFNSNNKLIHNINNRILKTLVIFIFILIPVVSAQAQSALSSGHSIGGDAPVDGAAFLLIAMGVAYVIKKKWGVSKIK